MPQIIGFNPRVTTFKTPTKPVTARAHPSVASLSTIVEPTTFG
jgi:hypothetical protein